ncbi:MAG TPA: TonB-dependent siderophore receptor [Verrucomicrobiae bacterium]|nr:TonB-dependent siderophore receptor [Verrucomicrobiae bacterium]
MDSVKDRKSGVWSSSALCAVLVSTGCALASPAFAQETTEPDIVVTAQRAVAATKSEAEITEIPQSISVITAEELRDRTVVDFQDVYRYSAGVAPALSIDSRGDFVSARGFSAEQYLDGLKRMPDFIYGARLEPFTLARAEVLRGPSSVLYGAGGPGGVLNGASKTPQFNFGGEVGLVAGSDNRLQAQGDVTAPLSELIAGRLVVVAREGETQFGTPDDRYLINPSLTFAFGENTELTLIALYQEDAQGSLGYHPLRNSLYAATPADEIDFDFYQGEPGFNGMDTTFGSLAALFRHSFASNITFNSRTRYSQMDTDYREVYSASEPGFQFADPGQTLLNRNFYINLEESEVLNTDNNLLVSFDTGGISHAVLVGVDYTSFDQTKDEGFSCTAYPFAPCWTGGSPPPIDIYNPVYGAPFTFGVTNSVEYSSEQLGIYVQDQISFADDRFHLLLGARHDETSSERNGVSEIDQTAWSYRGGLIGEVFEGFSPYVSYSESFLPVPGGDFFGNAYEPRTARQYEAGLKWEPNTGTLITFSYFDIEEENYISQDPNNIQNFIQGGSVGSQGYEIEAAVRVPGDFEFFAAYSFTESEVLAGSTTLVEGSRIAEIPEHLASAWFGREFELGGGWNLRAGGGVRYIGDRIDASQFVETPAVTLVDAMAALEYQNWSLSLNAANLFDEQYYAICGMTGAPDTGYCVPAKDRTWYISATRRF